ncbi:MAG: glycosyltransferase [Gammaproteobacteria bacterium]|nr:glycosyltransferase [Gammaproteobacteria bacterium]
MDTNITLVITMYNRIEMLRNILLSVSIQTQKVNRIIIADDGSEQDPAEILEEFSKELSVPITHVRQADNGFRAARSRNNGVRAADDGIIIFADQDVVFTPGYFEHLCKNMRKGKFLVGYLLRLDEKQSAGIRREMIRSGDFSSLVRDEQIMEVKKQYRKEKIYEWLHKLHLRPIGPKLRSGICAIYKSDIEVVNGFDEGYQGWGHEDDDLGWRLYAAGIQGKNVFDSEYSLHQYHPPHRAPGERVNKDYFENRKIAARKGEFWCEKGVVNDFDDYDDVTSVTYGELQEKGL